MGAERAVSADCTAGGLSSCRRALDLLVPLPPIPNKHPRPCTVQQPLTAGRATRSGPASASPSAAGVHKQSAGLPQRRQP